MRHGAAGHGKAWMTDLDDSLKQSKKATHSPVLLSYGTYCEYDHYRWPCPTENLKNAIREKTNPSSKDLSIEYQK